MCIRDSLHWLGGWPYDFRGVDFRDAVSGTDLAYIESHDPSIHVKPILERLNTRYRSRIPDANARQKYEQVFGMDLDHLTRPILIFNAEHPDEEILESVNIVRAMVSSAGKLDL